MYFVNAYGNDASQMSKVTIKKGTQFTVGQVAYGTGTQIYIPPSVQKRFDYIIKL